MNKLAPFAVSYFLVDPLLYFVDSKDSNFQGTIDFHLVIYTLKRTLFYECCYIKFSSSNLLIISLECEIVQFPSSYNFQQFLLNIIIL